MSEKNCGCLEIFNLETSSQHNLEVPDYSELTLNFKLYEPVNFHANATLVRPLFPCCFPGKTAQLNLV